MEFVADFLAVPDKMVVKVTINTKLEVHKRL